MRKFKCNYKNEIESRGFITEMETGYAGQPHRLNKLETLSLKESRRGLRLYVLEGFRKYSRNTVYFQRFVYLAGIDRGVYWAIRCPSTVNTIDEALDYTTPAAAKNAKKAGLRVYRQGDLFIIEKKKGSDNLDGLPENHFWDHETRTMNHVSHRSFHVPFKFKIAIGKSVNSKAD